jgi:hypothetical protein
MATQMIASHVVLNASTTSGKSGMIIAGNLSDGTAVSAWATKEVIVALLPDVLTTTKGVVSSGLLTLFIAGQTLPVEQKESGAEYSDRNGNALGTYANDHFQVVLKGLSPIPVGAAFIALDLINADIMALPKTQRDSVSAKSIMMKEFATIKQLSELYEVATKDIATAINSLLAGFYNTTVETRDLNKAQQPQAADATKIAIAELKAKANGDSILIKALDDLLVAYSTGAKDADTVNNELEDIKADMAQAEATA